MHCLISRAWKIDLSHTSRWTHWSRQSNRWLEFRYELLCCCKRDQFLQGEREKSIRIRSEICRVFFSFKKAYSPFLVVPSELPALFFSASCNPSHCWWKSKTKCARSETIRRFCQSDKPFASFFASSSNRPGRWTTTPLPKKNKHYCIFFSLGWRLN